MGGRLPLLPSDALDEAQQALRDGLCATRPRDVGRAGYRTSLLDGRLVGPFNVMLRVPRIAGPLLEWA